MDKKTENEKLREALESMLQSFDMLMQPGLMPINDMTRDVIRGTFYTAPGLSRKALGKPAKPEVFTLE